MEVYLIELASKMGEKKKYIVPFNANFCRIAAWVSCWSHPLMTEAEKDSGNGLSDLLKLSKLLQPALQLMFTLVKLKKFKPLVSSLM